ncbi:MAG TPA: hypothetical protein VGR03_02285, partial [Candidatus Acidoferrum sp.]|nr:hypothetical protein [Candidatus Acidoferrum sp.]
MSRLVLPTLFLIAAICVPSAFGQTTPDLEEGMKPYGGFHGGDIDQISLSSGKLVLNIPLVSYPQRGGKINVGFGLRWQNITPRQTEVYYSNTDTYVEHAFRDASSVSVGQLDFVDNLGWSAIAGSAYSPDQSLHQMMTPDLGATYRSIDATGLLYSTANTTLQTSNGLRYIYSSPYKVEDPNGNFVTSTSTGWIDTLGRTITSPGHATL